MWLACRTDVDAPKHKGISMICVPTTAKGFEWSLITTVGGNTTTATYYEDVRVPVTELVGQENEGWGMITMQLNHERVGLAAWSGLGHKMFADVEKWARETVMDDGRRVIDQDWVAQDLAYCDAELQSMWLLNWRMAVLVARDEVGAADSSLMKVYGTEVIIEIYRRLLGIVGSVGYVGLGSPGAILGGRLEEANRQAQINTFGGGVNEVQREILAMAGLGMKRAKR